MQTFEILIVIISLALSIALMVAQQKTLYQITLTVFFLQIAYSVILYLGRGALNFFNILIYATVLFSFLLITAFVIKNRILKITSISAIIYTIIYFIILIIMLMKGLS